MFVIFIFLLLGLYVYGFFQESKVTGLYKSANVYGRLYAWIFFMLIYGVLGCLAFAVMSIVIGAESAGETIALLLVGLVGAALCGFGGFWMYKIAYIKCPEPLRKKLLISLIISAVGFSAKIFLWFIPKVWNLVGPQERTGANGEKLYLYHGEVYDQNWHHVGSASADQQTYIKKS